MMLAAIMPGPEGFKLRKFECRKCNHSYIHAVANDPISAL